MLLSGIQKSGNAYLGIVQKVPEELKNIAQGRKRRRQ